MAAGVTVLLIEDNEPTHQLLHHTLRARYTVLTASCLAQAHQIRQRSTVDAIVIDVNLVSSDGAGLKALCADAGRTPLLFVANIDAEPDRPLPDCLDALLLALATRPVALPDLPRMLEDAIGGGGGPRQRPRTPGLAAAESNGILAESHSMRAVMSAVDRAALRDTPVLLIGESGTGKELMARALHRKSPRAAGPFVAVNCSAIPETLLESELFGHRKGAFTDACDHQQGLFQLADRGTIFLDEIGDMAPALQAKLLRVLQEKEVHPLGAPAPVPIDARVITATHRDPSVLVAEGRFREDLLYRINVIELRVPPLRERLDDLVPLVQHLLEKRGRVLGLQNCSVSSDAMAVLKAHPWPGNVRELENVIERALVLGDGKVITPAELPERLRERPHSDSGRAGGRRLADVEREHIVRTLRAVAGNKAAAARSLGLDRKTLYRKLAQHRIKKISSSVS
jgi:DNA-binding NtrC family response regulator